MMQKNAESQLLYAENVTKIFHIRNGLSSIKFHAVDDVSFTMSTDRPEIFRSLAKAAVERLRWRECC